MVRIPMRLKVFPIPLMKGVTCRVIEHDPEILAILENGYHGMVKNVADVIRHKSANPLLSPDALFPTGCGPHGLSFKRCVFYRPLRMARLIWKES